jgi:subtilisin family serine protease
MGVSVAVIDSDVASHPDLEQPFDCFTLGTDDMYGHGTHVAGIIGGTAVWRMVFIKGSPRRQCD